MSEQNKKQKKYWIYTIGRLAVIPIFKLLYFSEYKNKKNLPEGACIICSNHLSNSDPLLVGIGQKRQIRFMAKEELFENKFLKAVISATGAFPVTRGHAEEKGLSNAETVLKDGEVLGIFPEGTRSKTGELLRMRSGAALLAASNKVPVLPMCITPKGGKMKIFNKVKITYGELLTLEDLGITGEKPNYKNASRVISNAIAELREQDKF